MQEGVLGCQSPMQLQPVKKITCNILNKNLKEWPPCLPHKQKRSNRVKDLEDSEQNRKGTSRERRCNPALWMFTQFCTQQISHSCPFFVWWHWTQNLGFKQNVSQLQMVFPSLARWGLHTFNAACKNQPSRSLRYEIHRIFF